MAGSVNHIQIILVDDDPVANLLAQSAIKRCFQHFSLATFTDPADFLSYANSITKPTLLFLDLNMPKLTGWDVMDILETYPKTITSLLSVYIVSSSIDPDDHERADNNPMVKGYIEKPITDIAIKRHFN